MSIVDGGSGDNFLATVRLLSDPNEVERRFAQLNTAKAEADRVIALAGPATEILSIRKAIGTDLEAAKEARRIAEAQAKQIVADAQKQAEQLVSEAAATADKQRVASEEVRAQATQIMAAAQTKLAEANSEFAKAASKTKEAENAKALALQEAEMSCNARTEFENRLHSLRDIVAQFTNVLSSV